MENIYDAIQESLAFIRTHTLLKPRVGIVLGTGLSGLADDIQVECALSYHTIPYFPVSTVRSHKGELLLGTLGGQSVVAMAGRFHYYEGYSMQEVTFPIRVMQALGIEKLLISNAAGGINATIEAGDMVFVHDHINLQAANPLRGENDERLGPRFPDMLHTYDQKLLALAEKIANQYGFRNHRGVYVALQGPNLETPAEYNFLNKIGGDVVGMSTVPEVLVARHMSLPVFVISVVSNKCYPLEAIRETSLEDVIAVVQKTAPKVRQVVKQMLSQL